MKNTQKLLSLILSCSLILSSIGQPKANASNFTENVQIKGSNEFVQVRTPPKNWDPINASDNELNYYGYPQRPSDAEELEQWKKLVSTTWVKPEFKITETKQSAPSENAVITADYAQSSNWAGYIRNYPSYGVSGYWLVPSVEDSEPGMSSQWVGLGGANDYNTLAQIGTAAEKITEYYDKYYPWFYIVGSSAFPQTGQIDNFTVNPGDMMYTQVYLSALSGRNATINFYIVNLSGNYSTSYSKTISITDNNMVNATADWISERTLFNYVIQPYPKTITNGENSVRFWGCKYQTSINGSYTQLEYNDSYTKGYDMYSKINQRFIAIKNNISSGEFKVYWINYD